jgi:hypothetical protein
VAIADFDPASAAGIALTVLKYGAAGSIGGLLATIFFTPYFWYVAIREYGARSFLFMWPREVIALREKYPLLRFVYDISLALLFMLFLSLFGMVLILVRYRLS